MRLMVGVSCACSHLTTSAPVKHSSTTSRTSWAIPLGSRALFRSPAWIPGGGMTALRPSRCRTLSAWILRNPCPWTGSMVSTGKRIWCVGLSSLSVRCAEISRRMRAQVSAPQTCTYPVSRGAHGAGACLHASECVLYAGLVLNNLVVDHVFANAGSTRTAPTRLFPSTTPTSTSGTSSTVRPTSGR